MARHLRAVPALPFLFTLPSLVMPAYDLEVRRLGDNVRPLSTKDREVLVKSHLRPNVEVKLTVYTLEPPVAYAVVARRRCPHLGREA